MAASGWCSGADWAETQKRYIGNIGLKAVVLHVAVGGYAGSKRWLQTTSPSSSCHALFNNEDNSGEWTQFASIHDRTWANGLRWTLGVPWSPAARRPITGAKRALMAPWITPGLDPNRVTISIERSGMPTEPWKSAAFEALINFLQFIHLITGLTYVPGVTLIGHRDIDPVGKPFCPGPLYDFDLIARRANSADQTDQFTYVVERGPARVRELASTSSLVKRTIATGQTIHINGINYQGELLDMYGVKSSEWADVGDGWVWLPLLRRST